MLIVREWIIYVGGEWLEGAVTGETIPIYSIVISAIPMLSQMVLSCH